jgi:Chitobiase/beta-hexosaminidase C-terminal domain
MGIGVRRFIASAVSLGCICCGSLQAQVNVTTHHNDNARTGQNTQETILTPANVNSSQFGKLFSVVVDGYVYAQPLYLSGVTVGAATHNVLYVATEHDSLYGIDADSGAILSQVSLLPAGGIPVNSISDLNCTDLVPEIGITGTPVIDTTTGTLYVVAKSKVSGSIVQYLHAIDTSTLTEKFGGPVAIAATVAGSAPDGVNNIVTFSPKQENQRAALLLDNGHVIIGWSSHCDNPPWHGWVISYSASTLLQEAVFNTSPNGSYNGVWMSGGGLAADSSGNVFFATGNGPWDGTTDFGDSIVKLGLPSGGSFPVLDYFTPYNQASLFAADNDLASGGLVLLPQLASGQQLLAQMGKVGTMFVLDRNNMGKYCVNAIPACSGSDPQIWQEIVGATAGIWGAPAYWNGSVYWSGSNDNVKAFSFNAGNSGLISTSPTSKSTQTFGFPGLRPSISANGSTGGVLWGLYAGAYDSTCSVGSNCQILYAYDATNLGSVLYNSNQASGNRDSLGAGVKFSTPTIANGKVYVGSQSTVSAFGLLGSQAPAANPTVSPAAGTYSSAQTVTLSDPTPGAVIYYTTNGTTPTPASTMYSAPLPISATTTIKAIAVASGYTNSGVTSATFTITPLAANPTVSPAAGTYSSAQTVTLSDPTPGAAIYYTTNGTTPTPGSTMYSAPLPISATTTIEAIAVASGYTNSGVISATFTITPQITVTARLGGGGALDPWMLLALSGLVLLHMMHRSKAMKRRLAIDLKP